MMGQELERLWIGIKGDASHLHRTLKDGIAGIQQFAAKAQQIGVGMTAAFTAPALALGSFSVKAFGDFEQQMNNIRAAANPTAEQLKQLKAAIENTAAATGMDPAAVAAGFGELVKAGTSVKAVLGGVGDAVVQFARVGEMQMGEAAKVIVNAMTQFGGTAEEMANIISRAADASTIGIADVAAAFSTGGGALKQFNQNAKDVSAAIAILGNAGIAGADAGTSLKSMFITALSGAGEAEKVIKKFGLQFRDAAGQVKPMAALIEEVQSKLGGLDQATQDQALFSLFGSYGFRAASALLKTGAKGFDEFKASMASALPVGEKFKIMTEGFWGEFDKLKASLLLAAASIGEVLAPVLKSIGGWVKNAADWFKSLSPAIKKVIVVIGAVVAAIGPALLAIGGIAFILPVLKIVGLAIGALAPLILAVGLAVAGFVAYSGGWEKAWDKIKAAAVSVWEWLKPIGEALVRFGKAAWDAFSRLAKEVGDKVAAVWNQLTGSSATSWKDIQQTILDAINTMTFALGHLGDVADLVWKRIKAGAQNAFGGPATKAIMGDYQKEYETAFAELKKKYDDFLTGINKPKEGGDGKSPFAWLWGEGKGKGGAPTPPKSWAEQMKEWADKLGKDTGANIKKGIGGELQRIDAAAVDSAEGLFRIAAWRDALAARPVQMPKPPAMPPKVGVPEGGVTPLEARGNFNKDVAGEGIKDILLKIHETLKGKDRNGVEIEIDLANLDH